MSTRPARRILLLGATGKMGQALTRALPSGDEVIAHNSRTFDADRFDQVRELVRGVRPDVIFNTVAFLGIDPCEREPERAFRINSLYPRVLAECAADQNCTLVHFSTDAVFSDRAEGAYRESDAPAPINVYGLTKYGGDRFVQDLAPRSYLVRLSVLFGPTDRKDQFVERMLGKVRQGERRLRISDDIVLSPSYAPDVAAVAVRLVEQGAPYGLYHVANSGMTSLHGLMERIFRGLGSDVRLERASHLDFPAVGRKNLRTPLISEKLPPLRSWEEAADEYARLLAADRRA